MRMPGQTWLGSAAAFLGMWAVMMLAMMLPSLIPMLSRYRQAVGTGETQLGLLTALVGLGYFFVWTVLGMAAFPLGVALAAVEMQQPAFARAVPIAVGVVVVIAAHFSSLRGKRVISPAAGSYPSAAVSCRPTPVRLGDTVCASASIAASAVSV
jgi:predicted metal-binding membrane protein